MSEVRQFGENKISKEDLEKINGLKQLVFDTETTGLYVEKGERLIEIAAIEVIGGIPTGKKFHTFINPERPSTVEAFAVHRITDEFLKDKPLFKDVAEDFLNFAKGYEVVAHNAKFDVGFLDAQLTEIGLPALSSVVKSVICTVEVSKANYPTEKSHKLDMICVRQGIDLSERQKMGHNALLDCELLATVYMNMIADKGWDKIRFDPSMIDFKTPKYKRFVGWELPASKVSSEDIENHKNVLSTMKDPLFSKEASNEPMRTQKMGM